MQKHNVLEPLTCILLSVKRKNEKVAVIKLSIGNVSTVVERCVKYVIYLSVIPNSTFSLISKNITKKIKLKIFMYHFFCIQYKIQCLTRDNIKQYQ